MASISIQVYIAKAMPIHSFFPHLLHTAYVDIFMVIFVYSCHRPNVQLGSCLPFSRWKSSNQSHCNLKSEVKISLILFGLPGWSLVGQNVGIHYAGGVHKIPEDVLPCFGWHVGNIIFHVHLIMMIYTIHVSVVQLNILWLDWKENKILILYQYIFSNIGLTHSDPLCCLCEQHFLGLNLYWQVLQFYCIAKQWTPTLSCHPGMIHKHYRSFYQAYEYPLEDTSYSVILSHCSMFYKSAGPLITEQM